MKNQLMINQGIFSQAQNFFALRGLFSPRHVLNYFMNKPVTVNFLITSKCNLNCRICSARDLKKNLPEISTEELEKFFRQIKPISPVVFLGGGEPFCREDIFEILEIINGFGLKFGIVTNGTLLNAEKVKHLMCLAPDVLIVSLHGASEVQDSLSGLPGSFARISENIRRAVACRKKTKIILNCVINEANFKSLEGVVGIGRELGVDQVRFEHLVFLTSSELRAHKSVCSELFYPATNIQEAKDPNLGMEISKSIMTLKQKYGRFVVFKPYLSPAETAQWYAEGFKIRRQCFLKEHSIFILSDGTIVPCQFYPEYKMGNIKNDNIMSIWRGSRRSAFRKILNPGLLPGCMRCCKL